MGTEVDVKGILAAQDVADFFLWKAQEEDLITHMKLQKLLYYSQGFHLAIHDSPLFDEPIEKWIHGPVVPSIYHSYKEYGSNPLPAPETFDPSKYPEETLQLLEEIYQVYGQFTAGALRNLTHQEPPWAETPDADTISHAKLREYFKTQLVED